MNAETAGFYRDVSKQLGAQNVGRLDACGHEIRYMVEGSGWRYQTLLQKEPETIEWIDSFRPGETLWDIGANVGIYSVYAGVKGTRVTAFEPHFANYYQLCINIGLNGLQDRVTPLCLALADRKAIAAMNLASVDFGTSMSSFGEALDFRGNPYEPVFRQGMVGHDIDSLQREFGMPVPNHVKIDVDGIELPIVRGAAAMLSCAEVRSVSIELIESDAAQVDEVTELLARAGLRFMHKKQNTAFATPQTRDVLNYLFRRGEPASSMLVSHDIAHAAPRKAANDQMPADAAPTGEVDVAAIVPGIVECLTSHIAAAPVDTIPTENIYMEDVFPADLYREMIGRLPADHVLDPIVHPDAVAADGRVTRRLLDLTDATMARIDAKDRAFWQAMTQVFTAPALAAAVVERFKTTLHARFGDVLPELVAVPLLYRDYPGYRIGIHPDAPSKIATLQFYLPSDDSQRHLGTSFHTPAPGGFAHYKTNDFKPNAAYAFVRTDESWHSVSELGAHEQPRNTLALTFYIKGQEYRSEPDLMMPDLMLTAIDETPASQAAVSAPEGVDAEDVKPEHATYAEANRLLRDAVARFTRREEVTRLIGPGGVGVELGGPSAFSEYLLEGSQIGHLFGIGMSTGNREDDLARYKQAILRLDPYRDRNSMLRMGFDDAQDLFTDGTLDFVYADGCIHEGKDGSGVLQTWYAKLRSGCIIAGDDYHRDRPETVATVDNFIAANGLELHVIDCPDHSGKSASPTWFALKP